MFRDSMLSTVCTPSYRPSSSLTHAWISFPWSSQYTASQHAVILKCPDVQKCICILRDDQTCSSNDTLNSSDVAVLCQRCCWELQSFIPFWFSFHLWKPFVLLMLLGSLQVLPWEVSSFSLAYFLLFSSSISKGGSRKTPSGRVAESLRYQKKTSVRCSNLRRRLRAWTRSSSQVPGGSTAAVHPQLNAFFFQHILQGTGNL